jgi:four helix bundle protein
VSSPKFDLDDRLLDFAVAVGHIIRRLPSDRLGSHAIKQLARCSTAPAAQYAEAQGAESRRDFIHKLRIALKELRETLMWLRYVTRMELAEGGDLARATDECDQLIAILVKGIQTAGRRGGIASYISLLMSFLIAILPFASSVRGIPVFRR